nr:helix-turn-helix domain-containing protein [Halomicrobium zhouii]
MGTDVSEDVALGELLDLLSDDYARAILAVTSVRPMSAKQIAEECDMSQPTVYRRAQRLTEFDLLEEQTHVRTGGNDYNVYAATLSEFSMQLAEGSFEATVESSPPPAFPGDTEDDTADRFTKMWEHL